MGESHAGSMRGPRAGSYGVPAHVSTGLGTILLGVSGSCEDREVTSLPEEFPREPDSEKETWEGRDTAVEQVNTRPSASVAPESPAQRPGVFLADKPPPEQTLRRGSQVPIWHRGTGAG